MGDRLTHLEPVVAALKERADNLSARQDEFEHESRERWERHLEQINNMKSEFTAEIHDLKSEQRVNATKQALYFGILAFLGATIGGLVIKSGFDNMVSRISHIQQSKP